MTSVRTTPAGGLSLPRAGLRWVNAVLALIGLLLALLLVLLLTKGSALGLVTSDQRSQRLVDDITRAANAEVVALLTVDYRNMDPLIARVLKGSTGSFKSQYQHAQVQLKATAQAERVMSTGHVRELGVSEATPDRAVVFAAADGQVSNTATKGQDTPRYWRIQLSMTKVSGQWLVNDLKFVG